MLQWGVILSSPISGAQSSRAGSRFSLMLWKQFSNVIEGCIMPPNNLPPPIRAGKGESLDEVLAQQVRMILLCST